MLKTVQKKKIAKDRIAFLVEVDDNWYNIVFAHSVNQLVRTGEYEEIVRSPEYDRLAWLGYVPSLRLHLDNWRLFCAECEKEICYDCWDYEEDEELCPVFVKDIVYCSKECL